MRRPFAATAACAAWASCGGSPAGSASLAARGPYWLGCGSAARSRPRSNPPSTPHTTPPAAAVAAAAQRRLGRHGSGHPRNSLFGQGPDARSSVTMAAPAAASRCQKQCNVGRRRRPTSHHPSSDRRRPSRAEHGLCAGSDLVRRRVPANRERQPEIRAESAAGPGGEPMPRTPHATVAVARSRDAQHSP